MISVTCIFIIFKLKTILLKLSLFDLFDRRYERLFWEGTYRVQMKSLSNFSLMKCLSTSIYLIISCYIGLWAMLIRDLLSQYYFISSSDFILKSSKICFNSCHNLKYVFMIWHDIEEICHYWIQDNQSLIEY